MTAQMKYKDLALQLRTMVPVGMTEALDLMERSDGDLSHAVSLFEEDRTNQLLARLEVSRDAALKQLRTNGFIIKDALKALEEAELGLCERILRNTRNEESALLKIHDEIKRAYDLPGSHYWLDLKSLPLLIPEIRSVAVIYEWYSYEEYEGFSAAIYFHIAIVIGEMKQYEQLVGIADNLHAAFGFVESNPGIKPWESPAFNAYEDVYKQHKHLLEEWLFNFVKMNIKQFP